jgi:murein DD-endopeptidase MepM/ murein hydrolase activator NlpD
VKLLVRTLLTTLAATAVAVGASLPAHAAVVESHTSAVTVTVPAWPAKFSTYTGIAAGVCHNASLWPQIATDNGAHTPYWLRAGQRVLVRCSSSSALPAPAPRVIATSSSWVMPVPGAVCVSGYRTYARPHHNGVDLPRPWGTPIHAAAAGVVTVVRYQAGGAGWYVMLNHGIFQSTYMHMRARSPLSVGAHVRVNQVIGYVGSTGDSTGPHVHFEVHHGAWNQINPIPFMRVRGVMIRGC